MTKDLGEQILLLIRNQKKTYEKMADGSIRVFNHILYNSLDHDITQLAYKIGRQNKKLMSKKKGGKKGKL